MASSKAFKKTKPKRLKHHIFGSILFHLFFIFALLIIVAVVVYGVFMDPDLTKLNPVLVNAVRNLAQRLHLYLGFSTTQFANRIFPMIRIGILETIGLLVIVFGSLYFLFLPLVIKSHNKRVNKVRYDRKRFWCIILFILNFFACVYIAFLVSYLLIGGNDGMYASNDTYLPNVEAIKKYNFLYQGAYFVTYSYRAMLDFLFNIEVIRNIPKSSFIFPFFTTANASAVVILFISWFTLNIFANIFAVSGPKEKSSSLKVLNSIYSTVFDEYVDEKEFVKDLRTEDTVLLTDSKEEVPQISDQSIKELENKLSGAEPITPAYEPEPEPEPVVETVTDARPVEEEPQKEPEPISEPEPEPIHDPIPEPEIAKQPEPVPEPEPKKKNKKNQVNYVVYRDSIPSVEETQSKTGVTSREKKMLDELEPTQLSSATLDGIYKEDVNKILGELEPKDNGDIELPTLEDEEEEYLDFESAEQEVDVLPGIDEVESDLWKDNQYPLGDEITEEVKPEPISEPEPEPEPEVVAEEEVKEEPVEEVQVQEEPEPEPEPKVEESESDELLEDVVVDLEKVEDTQPVIEDVSSFIIDEETPVIELDTDTLPIEEEEEKVEEPDVFKVKAFASEDVVEEKEPEIEEVEEVEEKKEPDVVQVKSFAPEEIKEEEVKEPDVVQVKSFEPVDIVEEEKEEVIEPEPKEEIDDSIIPEYVEQVVEEPVEEKVEEKEPEIVIEQEPEVESEIDPNLRFNVPIHAVVEQKEEIKPKITPVTPFVMDEPVPPVHEEEPSIEMTRISRPMHEITSISKKHTVKLKPKRIAFELSVYNIKTYSGKLSAEEAFANSAIKVKPIAQPIFKNSRDVPSWKAKKEREDIRRNGYANITQNNTSLSKEGAIAKPTGVDFSGAKSIKDMLKASKNQGKEEETKLVKPNKPFTPPTVSVAEVRKRMEKERLEKEKEEAKLAKEQEKLNPPVPKPTLIRPLKPIKNNSRERASIKPVAPTKPVAPIKPIKKRR